MDTIGMGLVGTGLWGNLHADTYASTPGVDLVAVADIAEDKARSLADKHGAKTYGSHAELLKDERVQAVAIVTPDFAHADIAIDAARAGKHILCEKPLATTLEECERIVAASEEAGVKLMVDFHARWSPPFYKAREAIQGGEIGEVQHVYYRLSDKIFVPASMLAWAAKSTVMWFIGSHTIDTVRWLLNDEVERVYAVAGRRVLKAMGIDTPDYYQATLEFRSGATAVIENSWIMPDTMPNIIDLKCEVVGSKGAVYVDQSHNRTFEKYTTNEAVYPDIFVMPRMYGKQAGFASESIRHFVDCVREDKQPNVTGYDGTEVTRVILAIEESVRTGETVGLA